MVYIYALCDPDTGEIRYVGQTTDIERRYKQHLQVIGKPNTYRKSWIQSLLKQGKEPVMRILEEATDDAWIEREKWWINEMRRQGARLTNLTNGGDGVNGLKHTEEARRKMSEKAKGRAISHATRQKLSLIHKARMSTIESRQWVSQVHKGRKRSPETRKKQSEVRMGMKFSESHVANMSRVRKGKPAHNKGKPAPDTVKMGVSLAQRKLTPEQLEEIRDLLATGMYTGRQIASMYGVSSPLISLIKKGYTYYNGGN